MNQSLLFQKIEAQLGPKNSLISAVASVLDLSYDAAHRRTALKSKLSLDEAIVLCQHYDIILDDLRSTNQYILAEKTPEVSSLEDMTNHFQLSYLNLKAIEHNAKATVYYSAKDLPVYYFMGDSILSKFKIFVWHHMLEEHENDIFFSEFKLPFETLKSAKEIRYAFSGVNRIEIWNDSTLDSIIKQLHYFHQMRLINHEQITEICTEIKEIIMGLKQEINHATTLELYHNELLIMNNNVLIQDNEALTAYVPFSMLRYFKSSQDAFCKDMKRNFTKEMNNSKQLNSSNKKEKSLFFNQLLAKIDALTQYTSTNKSYFLS